MTNKQASLIRLIKDLLLQTS